MQNPKILVGCPTSFHKEYALKEYAEAVKSLDYKNYDILLVDNSQDNSYFNKIKEHGVNVIKGDYFESAIKRIVTSRNLLRNYTLENNYDYLFSLEQDVIPKKDALTKLISHDKEVISGIYFVHNIINNKKILIPQVFIEMPNKTNNLPDMRWLTEEEFNSNNLIRIVSCGLGCVLIHKNILEKIEFRNENNNFDDRFFGIDLYKKNIPIYCDTSVKCKHLILNRSYSWKEIKK
jgi:GT2 family glycosyltransferase